ncbi:MAG: tyrosine protein kinase, partial [Lachnospiraceae bacterium]|nr:tyrosine protein kinase [Lachnospiraceae bacterium]
MQDILLRDDTLSFRTREAFKTLRSNVEFSGKDVHTIAITSCTPNEGKTEVSFELARSFAQNNKRAILI